jgi:hypothetical protein
MKDFGFQPPALIFFESRFFYAEGEIVDGGCEIKKNITYYYI